jgi:hypothetical protein
LGRSLVLISKAIELNTIFKKCNFITFKCIQRKTHSCQNVFKEKILLIFFCPNWKKKPNIFINCGSTIYLHWVTEIIMPPLFFWYIWYLIYIIYTTEHFHLIWIFEWQVFLGNNFLKINNMIKYKVDLFGK